MEKKDKKKHIEHIDGFARRIPWIVAIVSVVATALIICQALLGLL